MRWITFLFLITTLTLRADDPYAEVPVYAEIADITRPTIDDYWKIQNYLTNGERSIIKRVKDYEPNCRNLRIIAHGQMPSSGCEAVNIDSEMRENCLVCYTSFNKNYPRGLSRLIE